MSKTEMEILFDKFIDIYHRYARQSKVEKETSRQSKDDENDILDPAEFKKMVEEQLPHYLKHARDPEAVKKLFADLDKDKNNKINFEECMALVAKILIFTHDDFHRHEGGHHGHAHRAHPH